MDNILNIKDLNVSFSVYGGSIKAVRDVSLSMRKGETLALVGESGCGKSTVAESILGLNAKSVSKLTAQEMSLDDVDLLRLSEKEMEKIRGTKAAMIFQDPLTSLNPTMKVGRQITETLRYKQGMTKAQCKTEAIRLLKAVRITEPEIRAEQYPYQFSGGMQQRAMIAMAIAENPTLLIADEPTTALDATIQLEILKLLKEIRLKMEMGILLITHDFSVVANFADRVAVMYAGKIVEEGTVNQVLKAPIHPYTQALIDSLPKSGDSRLRPIPGNPPDLSALPDGCAFADRCRYCMDICREEESQVNPCHRLTDKAIEEGN